METPKETLSNSQIAAADLADWRKLGQAVHARFRSPEPTARAAFVSTLLVLDRAPDVRLTADVVDVTVCTRADGIWVTPADIGTARTISELAHEHRLSADPGGVTQLELALDTAHDAVVGPFWSALLTGSAENTVHDSVFDPTGRVPAVWFQQSGEDEAPPVQRWHFDLWLAPEVADERIAAAVAAGGSVVFDGEAPAFTILADPDGNRVCVCTSLDRG